MHYLEHKSNSNGAIHLVRRRPFGSVQTKVMAQYTDPLPKHVRLASAPIHFRLIFETEMCRRGRAPPLVVRMCSARPTCHTAIHQPLAAYLIRWPTPSHLSSIMLLPQCCFSRRWMHVLVHFKKRIRTDRRTTKMNEKRIKSPSV